MFATRCECVDLCAQGQRPGPADHREGRVRSWILAVPAVVAYELEVGTLRSRDPELRRLELNRLLSVLFFRSTDGQPRVQRACGSIWKKQGQVSGHGIL